MILGPYGVLKGDQRALSSSYAIPTNGRRQLRGGMNPAGGNGMVRSGVVRNGVARSGMAQRGGMNPLRGASAKHVLVNVARVAPVLSGPLQSSETHTLAVVVSKIWDVVQGIQTQVNQLTENWHSRAELEELTSQLTTLRNRLSKTVTSAESQIAQATPLKQLQTDTNWIYAIVQHPQVPVYAESSTSSTIVDNFVQHQKILLLYNPVENAEGLWMQTRLTQHPQRRFWINLVDKGTHNMVIGQFSFT